LSRPTACAALLQQMQSGLPVNQPRAKDGQIAVFCGLQNLFLKPVL